MYIPVKIFIDMETYVLNRSRFFNCHIINYNFIQAFWYMFIFLVKVSLLHKNQWCNFLKEVFAGLVGLCILLLCIKTPVSSAYNLMLLAFTGLTISFIYRIKNNGPKTEPWGTPRTVLVIDFFHLYTCTGIGWSDRIEKSHWRVL